RWRRDLRVGPGCVDAGGCRACVGRHRGRCGACYSGTTAAGDARGVSVRASGTCPYAASAQLLETTAFSVHGPRIGPDESVSTTYVVFFLLQRPTTNPRLDWDISPPPVLRTGTMRPGQLLFRSGD